MRSLIQYKATFLSGIGTILAMYILPNITNADERVALIAGTFMLGALFVNRLDSETSAAQRRKTTRWKKIKRIFYSTNALLNWYELGQPAGYHRWQRLQSNTLQDDNLEISPQFMISKANKVYTTFDSALTRAQMMKLNKTTIQLLKKITTLVNKAEKYYIWAMKEAKAETELDKQCAVKMQKQCFKVAEQIYALHDQVVEEFTKYHP